ncbi:hypothetical protein GQX73_g7303 [Xylaria multiplex]|uniref:DUF6546 domain-containing protein n=1 Tax=Xylaria multiplex TaxID=323545 RepID=A0A7C8MQI2_9PEZI|nr:hypothetical protein GQX73_g7303 [Xylaria multiplex]
MAEIGDLPLEILEKIVCLALLPRTSHRAGQIASVNSLWQNIVEKKTFEKLRLGVDDISTVMEILRNRPERFSLVRHIIFDVVLPTYSPADCTTVESPRDRFHNDIAFSMSMNALLNHLGQWPSTGQALELQLYVFSPTDARCLIGNLWVRYWYGVVPGDILHNRMYGAVLELYRKTNKPVPAVTKFTIRDDCERYIAVSGFECLLRAFTGLKELNIRHWDSFKHSPDSSRRANRRRMALALEQISDSVRSMKFNVIYYPPADHRFSGQRTCEDGNQSDPLTVAYRNTTQKMIVVDVYGMLGTPELFWPKEVNAANPAPFWPNLKRMELYYHILDPTGEWLFDSDSHTDSRHQADLPFFNPPTNVIPAEDFSPMQNRFTANQQKMDDFYSAVAKAVANMPKLEHLRLQAITYWDGNVAPFHVFKFTLDGTMGCATWSGTPPFEPSVDVIGAWRKMARERDLFLSFESKDPE